MTRPFTCFLIFSILLSSLVVLGNSQSASSTDAPISSSSVAAVQQNVPPTDARNAKAQSIDCPSGEKNTASCDPTKDNGTCSDRNGRCFKDIGCCISLGSFCPATGLYSYYGGGAQGYSITFSGSLNKTHYYARNYNEKFKKGDVACTIPLSYSQVLPVAAVEWTPEFQKKAENNANGKLKGCVVNADCSQDSFCDAVFNPTFGKDGLQDGGNLDKSDDRVKTDPKSLRFCFPLPVLESSLMYEGQSMTHVKPDVGLKICKNNTDCGNPEELCHITKTQFRNESDPLGTLKAVYGICVNVHGCLKTDATTLSVLNENSQRCTKPGDCQRAGISKGTHDYDPQCRSYWKEDENRKMCCFTKLPPCKYGKAVTPTKSCSKWNDCIGDISKKKDDDWNIWCDDGNSKLCCKDLNNQLWQCPDLATPLFNEPKCTGVIKGKENSGKCPQSSGICVRGHCCPPLRVNNNGSTIKIGAKPFKTEFSCDPNTALPSRFLYAFCNPEDKKLIVAGKYHDNGDSLTKVSGKKCTINADCSTDGSSVCIYESNKVHFCYFNPLRPLRPPVSSFWKTVLIISLVCAAIFLILALISFVCYRSKSVFDKYKKKGKKGKDGKSSKGSKSKKGGKKGKKGGKKGKKGEKSSSSKSKTSQSKKSKTSESKKSKAKDTENTEATTGDGSSISNIN